MGDNWTHNKGVNQKLKPGTFLSTELREISSCLLFFKCVDSERLCCCRQRWYKLALTVSTLLTSPAGGEGVTKGPENAGEGKRLTWTRSRA
jgi:hypothetical protein